jgi:amino acid transporter
MYVSSSPRRCDQHIDFIQLQYIYRRPAYRENTILFSACLFGIAFIALGNMAGNCINFAVRVLQSANAVPADGQPDNGMVRAIAIAVATFACFIHTFSRRGGILLNNVLAIIKVGILLLIIITTIIVAAGGLPKTTNVIDESTNIKNSFRNPSSEANGYAQAFLAISKRFGLLVKDLLLNLPSFCVLWV